MGYAYKQQEKWATAIEFYKIAINRIEEVRKQTNEPLSQTDLFAQYTSHISPYFGLARSLLKLRSDAKGAFAVSEQAKARALTGVIRSGGSRLTEGLSEREKDTEQILINNISKIESELKAAGSTIGASALRLRLDTSRRAYDRFRFELFCNHPELRIRTAEFYPINLIQLNRALFSLKPDTCILSYMVDDDEAMLFVITRGESMNMQPKITHYFLKNEKGEEIGRKELNDKLQYLRSRCKDRLGLYELPAKSLYQLLIAPAEKAIPQNSHIAIIPDGPLNTLPFQVLMDAEGKHLLSKHTISYAPSVTAILEMMKLTDRKKKESGSPRTMFAMGRGEFPDQADYRDAHLPSAEEQAKSIAALFGAKPYVGADATKVKALAEMSKARYAHFATHGDLNEAAPMYSAIVLGKSGNDDGMLYARDLMNMGLRAELVTLSACNTGLGRQLNGEGLLGLTWSLFAAGTPSSIVTQWSVTDDSMNKLMLEFYRQLRDSEMQGARTSKAEALRKAQLNLMTDLKYDHPYYWAPTVLIGDWR